MVVPSQIATLLLGAATVLITPWEAIAEASGGVANPEARDLEPYALDP
jgi:hypothetical protein